MTSARIYARYIAFKGEIEHRTDAEGLLRTAGDAVVVRRGALRSVLMRCPDGCGQTLVVNLDPRAGKAWRLRTCDGKITIYPSVWRDGGCGSHFIVWRDRILWCESFANLDNVEPPYDEELESRIEINLGTEKYQHIEMLSADLDETEWDVSRACRRLVAQDRAEAGTEPQSQRFRRKRISSLDDLSEGCRTSKQPKS